MPGLKFSKFIEIWQKDFAYDRTLEEQVCLDKDGCPIPWYTYPAIEYLEQFDFSDKDIFEYGCGYSSLFWASRARTVTSVEDTPEWYEKWLNEFTQAGISLRLRDESEYANTIREDMKMYDVIIIDGKRRKECAQTALSRLKTGGLIILDDSDRTNKSDEYAAAIATLKQAGLLQVDFYGFCPMDCFTKATSLFFHRDFNFQTRAQRQPANGCGNLWGMSRKKRKEFYKETL